MKRRDFLGFAAAGSLAGLAGCAANVPSKARVVVVGGGFGGATAAKYIRMWDPSIDVVLVERDPSFVSCPISNLVLAGFAGMEDITRSIDGLARHGVRVVRDEVTAIDAAKKSVRLARGGDIAYERLVVSPGIDFTFGDVQGFEQVRDGGVYVLSIPVQPYRCPPGPYERASVVAAYFKQAKPRSKVLVLDANPDVTSKAGLFKRAWSDLYPGIIEYRGNARAVGVDGSSMTVRLEVEDVKGDVLNVVPPQRAGDVAAKAGLITTNNRWCDVDWRTMESKAVKGVHVLGDSTLSAPAMPKSASMANNHAKIAAGAIVDLLNGREAQPLKIINTCYSFVSRTERIRRGIRCAQRGGRELRVELGENDLG